MRHLVSSFCSDIFAIGVTLSNLFLAHRGYPTSVNTFKKIKRHLFMHLITLTIKLLIRLLLFSKNIFLKIKRDNQQKSGLQQNSAIVFQGNAKFKFLTKSLQLAIIFIVQVFRYLSLPCRLINILSPSQKERNVTRQECQWSLLRNVFSRRLT